VVIDVGLVLSKSILASSRLITAKDEVINGLMKSLGEVKRPCFTSKLATKHVLLTMVVSFMGSSSMQSKAQVLGVHP